jgi:hypothetical protein
MGKKFKGGVAFDDGSGQDVVFEGPFPVDAVAAEDITDATATGIALVTAANAAAARTAVGATTVGSALVTAANTTAALTALGLPGAVVADCVPAADGTSAGTQLNALLAVLRAEGIIASA